MRSHSLSSRFHHVASPDLPSAVRSSRLPPPLLHRFAGDRCASKVNDRIFQTNGCRLQRGLISLRVFDGDSVDIPPLDDWGENEGTSGYTISSSDGEDSDSDVIINSVNDVDLPRVSVSNNDALAVTAHRFAMLGRRRRKHRVKYGVLITLGLITFLMTFLLFLDWCAWRIVRIPLPQFYLTRPFILSGIIASCIGYIFVPLLDIFRIYRISLRERPTRHSMKKRTPTMGGLFFVPAGVAIALAIAGFSCIEVTGVAVATLAFAAIGFLDDSLSLVKNQNHGLSGLTKLLLEVAVGTSFSLWLDYATPLGLVCLGNYYLFLTSFCFVFMGNGVDLTDGLDGLAGGVAALAFIAMSIAVLPICADLAIFGASMAGACAGFLLHNRHKASVFMGNTGSLALGGALTAMAACTGMFFPLFISSVVFVFEALSVILQVSHFKATKHLYGYGHYLFRMAPFHHHLELCGFKEPTIVAWAYLISSAFALFAGYVGLRIA